jgi:hypothetical protein
MRAQGSGPAGAEAGAGAVSRMKRSSAATIAAASSGEAAGATSCRRGRRLTTGRQFGADTLGSVSRALDGFVATAPWPQRAGLAALVALGRRPRGARLLKCVAPAEQLAYALLAMEHYEDRAVAGALGWDAAAVVARGRALRRAEGRP